MSTTIRPELYLWLRTLPMVKNWKILGQSCDSSLISAGVFTKRAAEVSRQRPRPSGLKLLRKTMQDADLDHDSKALSAAPTDSVRSRPARLLYMSVLYACSWSSSSTAYANDRS
jgi:hypothetical protein